VLPRNRNSNCTTGEVIGTSPICLLATFVFIFAGSPLALADDISAKLMLDVKEVCTQPATAGSHWVVQGTTNAGGDVTVDVQALRSANLTGELSFTGEEWRGIQQVLAEHQADDNKDYRGCVREIAAIMMDKLHALEMEFCRSIRGQVNELEERRIMFRDSMDQTLGAQHERFKTLFHEAEREARRIKQNNAICFR
jgi:hypothetical protein